MYYEGEIKGTKLEGQWWLEDVPSIKGDWAMWPATSADIFILIPATANIIGKIANGLADDPVSSTSLSLKKECKKFFCPAMNNEMWDQKIVQNNCSKLNDLGWIQIGPDNGNLACGNIGNGRLSEIEEILKIILSL